MPMRKWTPEEGSRPIHNNEAWQLGKELATEAYRLTAAFPRRERFELTSQIRRSAVSIPSNIAERKGRRTDAEFLRFLYMARGSLEELDTQLTIADELRYLENTEVAPAIETFDQLSRTLQGLINAVHRDLT